MLSFDAMSFFWIYLRAPNDVCIRPLKREHTFVKYWKLSYSEPALFVYENLLCPIFKPFFLIRSISLYAGLQAVTQGRGIGAVRGHADLGGGGAGTVTWSTWTTPGTRTVQLAVRCLPLPSLQLCWLVGWCRLAINVPFLPLVLSWECGVDILLLFH
jgi:hypothetical protein